MWDETDIDSLLGKQEKPCRSLSRLEELRGVKEVGSSSCAPKCTSREFSFSSFHYKNSPKDSEYAVICARAGGYLMKRLEKARRLKRDRLLRYSHALFLTFIIFCREFNAPFLFPFLFLLSLQFHVVFMIHSFLFLAFGHNSPSLRLDYALTSIKIVRALPW